MTERVWVITGEDKGEWAPAWKGNGQCCPGSAHQVNCDPDCPDLLAIQADADMPCPPGCCWEPDDNLDLAADAASFRNGYSEAISKQEADPPRCHCCGELHPRGPCAKVEAEQ